MSKESTFKPVIKRKLILPVLKLEEKNTIYVEVKGKIYQGKDVAANTKKDIEKPADLCQVINLEDGELMLIIVPAVVLSVWNDEYPENAYVGKRFAITKGEKAKGKRYFKYVVDELE